MSNPRTCQLRHSAKTGGKWSRGDDETPGLVLCGNGIQQVKLRCNACGNVSGAIPHSLVGAWGITRDDVGWTKRNDPRVYDPCIVRGCGATPTEMHHFAPVNTFGWDDAELWPVLPLCPPHHREWHSRMDGYQRNAPGVAA